MGRKKISVVWDELKMFKNQHNFSFICPEICPPRGDSFLINVNERLHLLKTLIFMIIVPSSLLHILGQ